MSSTAVISLAYVMAVVPTLFDWVYYAAWHDHTQRRRWLSLFLRWRLVSKAFDKLVCGNVSFFSPLSRNLLLKYPLFHELREEDRFNYSEWKIIWEAQQTLWVSVRREVGPYVNFQWLECIAPLASRTVSGLPMTMEQFQVEHALWTARAPHPYHGIQLMKRRPDISPRDFMSIIVRYQDIIYGFPGWARYLDDPRFLKE